MASKRPRSPSPSAPSRSVRARSSSPPQTADNSKQTGALLNLPVELVKKIHDNIDDKDDRRYFAQVCRGLWREWGSEWLIDEWNEPRKQHEHTSGRVALFCLKDAQKGEDGYLPFFISHARLEEDSTLVTAVECNLDDLIPVDGKVSFEWPNFNDCAYDPHHFDIEFESERFNMCLADDAMIKERCKCPVCEGTESVLAGSKKLLELYSMMRYYTGKKELEIDCPRCTSTYGDPLDTDSDGEDMVDYLQEGDY